MFGLPPRAMKWLHLHVPQGAAKVGLTARVSDGERSRFLASQRAAVGISRPSSDATEAPNVVRPFSAETSNKWPGLLPYMTGDGSKHVILHPTLRDIEIVLAWPKVPDTWRACSV